MADDPRDLFGGSSVAMQVPLWARTIVVLGVPSAIALWLVWLGGQTIPSMEREIVQMHVELSALTKAVQDSTIEQENLYRLEQRMCSNAAHNDDERNRCFDK